MLVQVILTSTPQWATPNKPWQINIYHRKSIFTMANQHLPWQINIYAILSSSLLLTSLLISSPLFSTWNSTIFDWHPSKLAKNVFFSIRTVLFDWLPSKLTMANQHLPWEINIYAILSSSLLFSSLRLSCPRQTRHSQRSTSSKANQPKLQFSIRTVVLDWLPSKLAEKGVFQQ